MLLTKLQLIAAAVEATAGTAETLDATDADMRCQDIDFQGDIPVTPREGVGGFDKESGVPGARMGTASWSNFLQWDGSATLPDFITTLLPACGWVNSGGTFSPTSEAPGSNVKTLTIGGYKNGLYKQLHGCVGTFEAVHIPGEGIRFEWEFTGIWSDPSDVAILTPTLTAGTVFRYGSATTTFDSVALCVNELRVSAGNVIKMIECGGPSGNATGYKHGIITDRHPVITGNPESTLVGTDDPYSDWSAGTEAAFSLVLDGPSTSDVTWAAPKAQIYNCQEEDDEGLMRDAIEWRCNKNGSNQDQSLTVTFNNS